MIETDHRPLVEKIMARTLLIWGDKDAYFSVDEQKRLLAGIKGAQMNVYEGIGHAPNWESPERTAKDIESFLRRFKVEWSSVATGN